VSRYGKFVCWCRLIFLEVSHSLHIICILSCLGLREVYEKTQQDDHVSSQPWPAQTFLEVEVPFYTLVESYHSLLTGENNGGIGGVDIATRYVINVYDYNYLLCQSF